MNSFFTGIKAFIASVVATASVAVSSIVPSAPVPTSAPPVPAVQADGDNFVVLGKFSYFGQSVTYSFLIPKKGGDFSGSIEGVCKAQVTGSYEGGNGGKINGRGNGKCDVLGLKGEGSANFNGNFYPDSKLIEVRVDNSPINPIKLNYD